MADLTSQTADTLYERAPVLARQHDTAAAAAELAALAGGDRNAVEEARDRYARRLHGNSTDWDATAALTVLNLALVSMGWQDPYSWKGRRKP